MSTHTIDNYGRDLHQFDEFLTSRKMDVGSVDHLFIRDYMNQLYTKNKLKKSSVARKLACLKSFFKLMVREDRLKNNPAELVSSPRLPKRLPTFLQQDEAAMLVQLPQGDSFRDLRDHAILELLYASGLRVGELVGLNDHGVDMAQQTVLVLGKRNKQRMVPFGDFAARALAAYIEERNRENLGEMDKNGDRPLFVSVNGRRLNSRDVQRLVVRFRLSLSATRRVTPHTLRHS